MMFSKGRKALYFIGAVFTGAVASLVAFASPVSAVVGDGTVEDVSGDAPSEVWNVVQDTMVENLPQVIVLAAAIFIPLMSLRFLPMLIGKVRGIFNRIVRRSA